MITASLATIPGRRETLKRVVSSLLPQVDRLNVYLNGYGEVPDFLSGPKIRVARSEEHRDRGDAGKFFWENDYTDEGYRLTCDDDIVYPPDYAKCMVSAVERYDRRVVVTLHGAVLKFPVRNYYADRVVHHCRTNVLRDAPVHVGGTGVMAWHSSAIRLSTKDFEKPNMADIWMALAAKRKGVPIIVLAHAREYLEILLFEDTIYGKGGTEMTEVISAEEPWEPLELESVKS